MHEKVIRKWMKDFDADPGQAFPGQGHMKPDQAEIERLKREVQKLKAERDILKKATADSNGRRNMASIGCHLRRINDVAHGATGPISGTEARALDAVEEWPVFKRHRPVFRQACWINFRGFVGQGRDRPTEPNEIGTISAFS